ncbi:MAG: nucleotide kinase [Peptococcaceae bacterium]|jgi:nucleoside-triphosphatase|nr:nucleotide kinase [Peptococcaceae bacterium]
MHIFLTGEIQVGKSTVIAKTLSLLDITPGGFRTYFGPDRKSPNRLLYMNSASEAPIYKQDNAIAIFSENKPPQPLTDKFDIFGSELIRAARANSKLILMDECGSLERKAFLFQKTVLESLDYETPILGVIKLDSFGWTDQIKQHPKVKLFFVTVENRDTLPIMLAKILKPKISSLHNC